MGAFHGISQQVRKRSQVKYFGLILIILTDDDMQKTSMVSNKLGNFLHLCHQLSNFRGRS